jgi:hypothetical protein
MILLCGADASSARRPMLAPGDFLPSTKNRGPWWSGSTSRWPPFDHGFVDFYISFIICDLTSHFQPA